MPFFRLENKSFFIHDKATLRFVDANDCSCSGKVNSLSAVIANSALQQYKKQSGG
jgi:hypothetical protein